MSKLIQFAAIFIIALSFSFAGTPEGFSFVKESGGIEEYKLESNGLRVLLLEDHSAPVLTLLVTFHVGSRNEVTGTTGSTHLLEHLMFKGTKRYSSATGNNIASSLQNIGARLNATTWTDRTNYYESIPSEHLELAIDIESDRMRNLLLLKEDKESEMTVVRNEYERGENDPYRSLDKQIWATAFQAHPYHHSTIGWRSDIENVTIEKLRDFYNTYYWPNNATVTIIGDFNKEDALSLIKKYYGKIPASKHEIPDIYTVEPEQQGARRVLLKRPGQQGVVCIAWKIPGAMHEDTYTLAVLDNIMQSGKNSRMYKALVDKSKVTRSFDDHSIFKDPSLYMTIAFLSPGIEHQEVEKIILEEFEKVKTDGVTNEEVKRSINQIAASTAYGRDGSFSIASNLNESIAHGDWTFYTSYLDNIKKVNAQRVQDVVKKYFVEDKSTTGYFIPITPGGGKEKPESASLLDEPGKLYFRTPGFESPAAASTVQVEAKKSKIADNITRKSIHGIDVITTKTGVKNVISFRGVLAAGDIFSSDGNSMIADLTGGMLDKGTTKNDKFALAEKLENIGARISFGVGKHNLTFNGRCLKDDLPIVIELLAEQLRMPAFEKEELEKLKIQREGFLKRRLENTSGMASDELNRILFSKTHPNYDHKVETLIEDLKKTTVADLKAFYKKHYGPKSMIVVLAGDVDDPVIFDSFKNAFAGWEGGIAHPQYKKETQEVESGQHTVTIEGKTSVSVYIGQKTGLKRSDKDYLPFYIGNNILGLGFSDRLMSIVRDKEGLTYGIYSRHSGDIYSDGRWYITATFSPDLLKKGIVSSIRELKRWVNKGITEEELNAAKNKSTGSYKVNLATSTGMASQILTFVQRGYDISYMDDFPMLVNKLTLDEVNSAVKKYIDPDAMVTVMAGSIDKDGKPLSKK